MPSIMYAHLRDVDRPERFEGALIIDTRFQSFASLTPAAVAPLFASGRYLHVPSLGSQACTNGAGDAGQVIDFRSGLAEVQAAHEPGQKIIVLCSCAEVAGRSHRRLIAHELAAALALEEEGPLP